MRWARHSHILLTKLETDAATTLKIGLKAILDTIRDVVRNMLDTPLNLMSCGALVDPDLRDIPHLGRCTFSPGDGPYLSRLIRHGSLSSRFHVNLGPGKPV